MKQKYKSQNYRECGISLYPQIRFYDPNPSASKDLPFNAHDLLKLQRTCSTVHDM